jgi:SAC3/GANP family
VGLQVDTGPENFRTMAALQRTQRHLRGIMDRSDVPLVEIHKFLWDRYRGVRQDLFVQGLKVPAPF